jgi:hypothetical protein
MYGVKNEFDVELKIKGVHSNFKDFDLFKKKFYDEMNFNFKSQLQFKKRDFNLTQSYIDKVYSTDLYDKRKFINNKKSTNPLTY